MPRPKATTATLSFFPAASAARSFVKEDKAAPAEIAVLWVRRERRFIAVRMK
jgi:hypothetical protein